MTESADLLEAARVALPLASASLLALFVNGLAIYVGIRAAQNLDPQEGLPGHVPQLVLFAVVVNALAFAVLGIGKAFELVEDAGGTIALILFTAFGPWLGYKAITRKWSGKSGPVDLTSEKE